jgi:hypothetical protein
MTEHTPPAMPMGPLRGVALNRAQTGRFGLREARLSTCTARGVAATILIEAPMKGHKIVRRARNSETILRFGSIL